MPGTKVKVKAKNGRSGKRLTKIKSKVKGRPYIGGEAERLHRELQTERNRTDSLQRKIDSLECEIKIKIESK